MLRGTRPPAVQEGTQERVGAGMGTARRWLAIPAPRASPVGIGPSPAVAAVRDRCVPRRDRTGAARPGRRDRDLAIRQVSGHREGLGHDAGRSADVSPGHGEAQGSQMLAALLGPPMAHCSASPSRSSHQCFTAPCIRPDTIRRCATKYTMISGRLVSTTSPNTSCHRTSYWLASAKLYKPSINVSCCGLLII